MKYIRPFADATPFLFEISFSVETDIDVHNKICEHYRQLGSFYQCEVLAGYKEIEETDSGFVVYRVHIRLEKSSRKNSFHLSKNALVNILEYDLQIILQLYNIFHLEYHIKAY